MKRKSKLTHAGGVVYRLDPDGPRYLVVTARRNPEHWVFPKGHIEPGESADETAVREVREEAGVTGGIREYLGVLEFKAPRGPVRAAYYLMASADEGAGTAEGRQIRWCGIDEARGLLSFENSRTLLERAHAGLSRSGAER